MSATIDSRVLEMRFDNRQFEQGVSTTMSTLDKLKQKLNFTGASKGLDELGRSAKNVDMSGLGRGVETVQAKFSALQVAGVTALVNITNSAVNAGKRMVKALTIDPIKTGFNEYETKMNSIQTIMSNTASKGTTMSDVTRVIDELNTYADKTIYNFAEMTRNIGTFTAAGVGLEESAAAIKGIANLAAASGSSSQQASTAMYQLSQALATGTVKLMDWNSVVNAGMGGEKFQEALKATAREHGVAVDEIIKKQGSFRDSLQEGWLSADIMNETLNKFTVDGAKKYAQSMMESGKWTQEQADALIKEAQAMEDAATKVKTFTQLWDTLKEAAQSGWGKTWEIIFGDFEEAKEFFTYLSDTFGGLINASSDARNKVLQEWKDLGGRTDLIDSLKNVFEGVGSIIKPISEAFRDIFPPITAKQLKSFTSGLKELTSHLEISDKTAQKLKSTFKGVFSVIDIVVEAFKAVGKGVFDIISNFTGLGKGVLGVTGSFGDFLSNIRDSIVEGNIFGNVVDNIVGFLTKVISKIKEFGSSIKENTDISSVFNGFLGFFQGVWNIVKNIGSAIANAFGSIVDTLANAFGNGDIFEVINGGLFAGILLAIRNFIKGITVETDKLKFLDNIKQILDSVKSSLESWQQSIQATTLLKIAAAIGILAAALYVISGIDSDKLSQSLGSVGVLFGELIGAMALMGKLNDVSMKPLQSIVGSLANISRTISMIGLGAAVLILAGAMRTIASLDWDGVAKGLVGISGLVGILVAAARLMNTESKSITKFAGQMVILSAAVAALSGVAKILGSMSWEELAKGGAGILGIVTVLVGAAKIMDSESRSITKFAGQMVIMSAAVSILAVVGKKLSSMSWSELAKGGVAILGLVTMLVTASKIMSSGGGSIARFGGQMLLMAASLAVLTPVLKSLGSLSVETIAKGLITIGLALVELSFGLKAMNGTLLGSAALLVAAGALAIMGPTLKTLGSMSVGGIAKSLITLAAAFGVIGVAGYLLAPLIPTILGLAGAFALFGIATAGLGIGLAAIGAGFAMLATSVSAGVTALVAAKGVIITSILSLIPQIAQIIGRGIVEIAKVIGEYAPQLATSFLKLITEVLSYLSEYAPQLVDSLLTLLIGVINGVANHMPELIEAVVNLINSIFKGVVDAIKGLDVGDAIGIVAAITSLLLGMSVALKILSSIKISAVGAIKGILLLTAMAIPLLAFVGILKQIDGVDVAAGTVLSLIGLTTAMSLLLIPLTLIGSTVGSAIKGVLALTTMAVPLLAFVGVLKLMEGVEQATENVKALVLLAGALTLMLIPLTVVGAFVPAALAGVVALTAMSVPLLAFVGILKLMDGIDAAMTNAIAITMLMSTLGDVLFKISLVAPLAIVAVAAINALVITIGAIGVLATAIGALMDKFPSIQKFLDTGLPVLEQLAGSIGTMVGNLIGNFGEAIGDSLTKIGNDIAAFMMALHVASVYASGIKGESFSGVKDLIGVMGEIAKMTVGTSVSDVFTLGGTSMEKFQTDSVAFFNAMSEISKVANGVKIDEKSFNAVISAATKLADLQSSLEPIGGVISWFTGRDDLASFGTNIGQFFTSIKTAFASLEGMTVNTKALTAVIDASTKLATLQSSLEPIGGVISWFKGRDDLATFGTNVGQFFASIKTAFTSLDGISVDTEALTAVIDASTKLATLQSSLENIGGVVDWFTGRDDLATFGDNIGKFMGSMTDAMDTLDGATVDSEALASVIDAATKLAELQSSLENMGGVIDWFTGRDDLGTFGTSIGQFAEAMGTLKEKMGEDGISEAVVTSVTNAGEALIALDGALPEKGFFDKKVDLSEFATYIEDFATAIKDFNDKVKDIDSANMSIAIDAANKIKTLCDSLKDFDTSGVAKFTGIGTGGYGADGPISDIAEALADFCSKTADIDTGKLDITVSAAKKLKTLISSLAGLDTSGIENFKIDSIATAINDYYTKISAVDPAMLNLSIMSVMRLKSFISGLAGFDSTGVDSFKTAIDSLAQTNIQGFVTAFQGAAQTLSTVGTSMINSLVNGMRAGMAKLPSIASSIMTATITVFTSKAAVLSSAGMAMINSLAIGLASGRGKCISIMSTLVTTLVALVLSKTTTFAPAGAAMINGFAVGLSSGTSKCIAIVASLSGAISNALVSKVPLFHASGLAMTNGLARGLTSGKSRCISVINSIVAAMANAIRSKAPVFTSAGSESMARFAKGILKGKSSVVSAAKQVVSAAADACKGKYSTFYSAGSSISKGLAAGIRSGVASAKAAARELAQAAETAAKAKLKINSPSKVFRAIGSGIPEGFVQGIKTMGSAVKRASRSMADTAIVSTTKSMARVYDIAMNDTNIQPTISPIVDLDNVKAGAKVINGLLNTDASVNLTAKLNSISASMNRRNQNGTTEDVITAIDRLRKDLGKTGNTTYNVNGITYDDGSSISEAIETLVRAAKIERRV